MHFSNDHKKRYRCPWCHKVFIGMVPRGSDGSVRLYPHHETKVGDFGRFKCAGTLRVCEAKHEQVTRND